MSFIYWLIRATIGRYLASVIANWFAKTAAGMFINGKLHNLLDWAVKKYDIQLLETIYDAYGKLSTTKKSLTNARLEVLNEIQHRTYGK